MYWKLVSKADARARTLADRHYSRQSPGHFLFTPPGNNIVLLGLNNDALWVSHRIDPSATDVRRKDGFEYWDNPYFRNESEQLASDLILQALAVTLQLWGMAQLPRDGFHSFVDPQAVKPTIRHGESIYGWVFEKAGFVLYPEPTRDNQLLRYIYPAEALRYMRTQAPVQDVISFKQSIAEAAGQLRISF